MTTTRFHICPEIVTGSTYAPIPIVLWDVLRSEYCDLTGATVTLTLVDEATGEVIVQDGEATANEDNPYIIEYFLTELQAAKIKRPSVWIGHWKLTAATGRLFNVPTPYRIPVRPSAV